MRDVEIFARKVVIVTGVVACAAIAVVALSLTCIIAANNSDKSVTSKRNKIPLNSDGQYYYFPRLGNGTCYTRDDAIKICSAMDGYKLAGTEVTYENFLEMTRSLVEASEKNVAAGGYFMKETDGEKYIVWQDSKTHQAEAANQGITCESSWEQLQEAVKSSFNDLAEIPLVRTKENPDCLSLPSAEALANKETYTPLCVRKESTPYLIDEISQQMFVPPFITKYPMLFDSETKTFSNMGDRLKCLAGVTAGCGAGESSATHKDAIVVRSHVPDHSPYIAGFLQTVNLETAKTICSMMRYGDAEGPPGSLLTYDLLNSNTGAGARLLEDLKNSMEYLSRTLQLQEGTIRIPTEAYFKLPPRTTVDSIESGTMLIWRKDDNEVEASEIDDKIPLASNIGWCTDGEGLISGLDEGVYIDYPIRNKHNDFTELPVGIRPRSSSDLTPCLFVAKSDLWTPGSVGWIPTCQLIP